MASYGACAMNEGCNMRLIVGPRMPGSYNCRVHHITETSRIQLVLSVMQNRTSGPFIWQPLIGFLCHVQVYHAVSQAERCMMRIRNTVETRSGGHKVLFLSCQQYFFHLLVCTT
jgi:hypothetical protein